MKHSLWVWIHSFGSPLWFYRWSERYLSFIWAVTVIALACGLVGGLYLAPTDAVQGEAFRIIYVHVPCALLSMGLYVGLGFASFLFLIWRVKLAPIIAQTLAPLGFILTALALITGSLWGKPMWGTFWIWDARLSSELILLFLYAGYMALQSALKDYPQGEKICAILALVGLIDIPIIHYSVQWWNTLHQGATISKFAKPSMDFSMAWPLFTMILGFSLLMLALILTKVRAKLLILYSDTRWVKELMRAQLHA